MMSKYTYADIIMNPNDPSLKSLIGKEVYYSNVPFFCLNDAKHNRYAGILIDIFKDDAYPFRVKDYNRDITKFACIIKKKKKPKPECIPFESMEKFVRRYREVIEGAEPDSFEDNLFQCGMWLKDADADTEEPMYRLVYEIRDKGVRIADYGFLDWVYLLYNTGLTFLDGSPCGKEVK